MSTLPLNIEVVLPLSLDSLRPTLHTVLEGRGSLEIVSIASAHTDVLRIYLLPAEAYVHDPNSTLVIGETEAPVYDAIPPYDLRRLARSLHNLLESLRLRRLLSGREAAISALNGIGRALSSISDRDRLMDEILLQAQGLTNADGGSIYLVEGDHLRFAAARNDTTTYFSTRLELALDESSLAGWVATHGRPLNLPEVRKLPEGVPYRLNLNFDKLSGYLTRSMLLVPLTSMEGRVIGVLALVNRKPNKGPITDFSQVLAFGYEEVELAASIASQASVAIEGHRLYRSIQTLFDGFVQASVAAIESRDPSTGGHSVRVAELAHTLAAQLHLASDPELQNIRFTAAELKELNYAALLHDFGKVGVREEVLRKSTRLLPGDQTAIKLRFRMMALQLRHEIAQGRPEAQVLLAQLMEDQALIERLNLPDYVATTSEKVHIRQIQQRWILEDCQEPVLDIKSAMRLMGGPGSLDAAERLEIERHVEHTWRFLRTIPWTEDLQDVPEIAYTHHERLDGSGYPRHLPRTRIPLRASVLAVADVFDALTAGDRPYRRGMAPDQAADILCAEADAGKIHKGMVELFTRHRLWEGCERWGRRLT